MNTGSTTAVFQKNIVAASFPNSSTRKFGEWIQGNESPNFPKLPEDIQDTLEEALMKGKCLLSNESPLFGYHTTVIVGLSSMIAELRLREKSHDPR